MAFDQQYPSVWGASKAHPPGLRLKCSPSSYGELEADHLIIRTVYPVVPPKVEYALSDLGTSIRPILEAMYNWGADYLSQNGLTVSCSMKFPT